MTRCLSHDHAAGAASAVYYAALLSGVTHWFSKEISMADKKNDIDFDELFGSPDPEKKTADTPKIRPETHSAAPASAKEENKRGLAGGALYFLFVISLSVIIACLGWAAATDVLGFKSSDTEAQISLDKEMFTYDKIEVKDDDGNTKTKKVHYADIGYVADTLKDNGIIKYKWLFKLFAAVYNADEKIDPGTYELKAVYDYKALINKMTSGSGAMVTKKITFPEGYTMNQIFKKLEAEGVCDYDELMDAAANSTFNYSFLEGTEKGDATRLEGFLFPDTYEFYEGMPAATAINKLLEGFHYRITAEMLEWQAESGYTMREIITIASMIEKEAANDSEQATISSVIHNRLNKDWELQIDSTTLYEYPDHVGAPTAEMLAKDSPYNTRISKGLPPSPICSPGITSIRAALKPSSTSYMFYALNTETGQHEFFTNSDSFNAFVATQNYD